MRAWGLSLRIHLFIHKHGPLHSQSLENVWEVKGRVRQPKIETDLSIKKTNFIAKNPNFNILSAKGTTWSVSSVKKQTIDSDTVHWQQSTS